MIDPDADSDCLTTITTIPTSRLNVDFQRRCRERANEIITHHSFSLA
ncbi:hypothetical protein RSSM_06586 [Rhodopirellula sallentina SM41]|uniref:Uncharacterized protein n=1 Tax=Rhodopirellula sallentina SM41 TaxID=1263870 RepID=M5U7M2_9BACT|nr:hypothetical protein RSSM_06586 [Rhodopirellula sallentina SM41]